MSMARRRPSSTASSTPRGATQSPARSVPGRDQVEGLLGQPVAAVDEHGAGDGRGCSPVHTSSSRACPSADAAEQGPQLAAHAGPLQPGVGVGQVTGERQQGAGDLVRGDQGHLAPGAGQPLGHADADRTADRVVDHHRSVREEPGARRPAGPAASTTGHDPSTGTASGAGRDPVASTTSTPSARAASRSAGRGLDPGLDRRPPGPRHSAISHSASTGQALAARARPRRPATPRRPGRTAPPPAPGGPAPASTRAHSSPATPAPTTSTSRADRRRSPRPGARRSRARCGARPRSSRWGCGCPGRGRPGCRGCRAGPGPAGPARTRPTRRGSAIWARVISTRSATPSSRAALGHRRVDHAALQDDGGPPGRRLAHLAGTARG